MVIRSQIGKHYLELVATFEDNLQLEEGLRFNDSKRVPPKKKLEILKQCWDFAIELFIQDTFTSVVMQCMQTIESLDRFKTSREFLQFLRSRPSTQGGQILLELLRQENRPNVNIIDRLKGLISATRFEDLQIMCNIRDTPNDDDLMDIDIPDCSVPGMDFDEKILQVRTWLQDHIESLDDEEKTSDEYGGQEFRKPSKHNSVILEAQKDEEGNKIAAPDVTQRQENITLTEQDREENSRIGSIYWFSIDDMLDCLNHFCPLVTWQFKEVQKITRSGETPVIRVISGSYQNGEYVRL